jgi:hypothetical protein
VRALAVLAATVAFLAVTGATAQAALPVGESHGVRVVRERGAIVVVFTKRAAKRYRRIAGRMVEVDCTDRDPDQGPPRAHTFIGPESPGELTEVGSGGVTMRAPKRGRRLATGDLTRGLDYCRVWLPRKGKSPRLIVSVPLTQAGAVFLDEETRARRLLRLLFVAGFVAEDLNIGGWPSHAQLVARLGPKAGRGIVDLAAPSDTPPAGRIGYYSDRRDHVAAVNLSRSRRRLFIEFEGDALSTNVVGHIFNERSS